MVSIKTANQVAGASSSTLSVGVCENCLQDVAISAINNILGLNLTRDTIKVAVLPKQLTLVTPDGSYHKNTSRNLENPSGIGYSTIFHIARTSPN